MIEGEIDAWIDGELHHLKRLETSRRSRQGPASVTPSYPLHPGRRNDIAWSRWWDDVPQRPRGAHDGKPQPR